MFTRRKEVVVLWCVIVAASAILANEAPPGLVSKDSDQDLIAEATRSGSQTQKREAALSNSYGEPLPSDAYGPPREIKLDLQLPAPVYGVPEFQNNIFQEPPPGAYGPPSPVIFPSQNYQGPPPPISKPKPHYGPPKHGPSKIYGSPKPVYGPPKHSYGPPKKIYGPPKQGLPKPIYGAPFKPPKFSLPKPSYGPPKPVYGPPKPVYGPPKISYTPPLSNVPNVPLPELPPVSIPHNFGFSTVSTTIGTNVGANVDLGLNLPAPIYGTPVFNLPSDLKPNFPIPADTYGPPGNSLGPIGPNDQLVVQDFGNIGHYGPPQPDPNPQPPHPGIPAPPTPPHVLYDGWKPIPGVSKPFIDVHSIGDQYGPPPPPPQVQEIHINLNEQSLPNLDQHHQFSDGQFSDGQFSGAQITTGYSNVHHDEISNTLHQDALANIDLNSLVGGDSNHIDQSKTVFEAHFTENHNPQSDLNFIQSAPSGQEKPFDTYGAPPLDSLSNGPYPSPRQQGAKGLVPPSGVYGVPPGSQYGAPPRPLPSNLPIPYGSHSGGGHSGGNTPRNPVKFRESVPEGLLEHVGKVTHGKDINGIDHLSHGPSYLPPPIRDIKDVNQQTSVHGVSLSIEPSNLYSLPHSGNPISFQHQPQPSNLYGSPIDSYSVPLLTVGDHTASGSNTNSVTATVDGTVLANLSNLDAAAILKHCPYHEAILRAAKYGDKIPQELASDYVASLSSLGSTLNKNHQILISPHNSFNVALPGSESVSYSTKDLSTASHTLVQSILPNEKDKTQKGKSSREINKQSFKQDDRTQFLSNQILETSEKIRNLSEETRNLQQKLASTGQNIHQVGGHLNNLKQTEIPLTGNLGSYSLQIQSSNNDKGNPTIPHDQLLSEGLLQSILQAIEQPHKQNGQNQGQQSHQTQQSHQAQQNNQLQQNHQQQQQHNHQLQQQQNHQLQQQQNHQLQQQQNHQLQQQQNHQLHQSNSQIQKSNSLDYAMKNDGGLILPAGYEPIDRRKEKDQETQSSKDIKHIQKSETHKHRGDISDCDLRGEHSIQHSVILPAPTVESVQAVDEIGDNDVAIYFNEKSDEKSVPVTEISVATSISENIGQSSNSKNGFGDRIKS